MSSTVHATTLDPESALHDRIAPGDFIDCYSVRSDLPPRPAAEIIARFPGWVRFLVALRGLIVAPFGLRTSGPSNIDKIGEFPVESETREEVIAGFNDRHLNFRICVRAQDGQVSLATWVRRHNLGGRLYLALIMPFHILVVRNALVRLADHSRAGNGA